MRVEGDAVVSTIKMSEDGGAIVVRLFNPSDQGRVVSVALASPVHAGWKCDLTESPVCPISLAEPNSLNLALRGKEIVTLRLEPD
ncbi:MAG: glycosyl hydrolase-related protein [Armatimonadota bacterium]